MDIQERRAKVARLYREGTPRQEIARRMGVTDVTVLDDLRAEGISPEHDATRWKSEYHAEKAPLIRDLAAQGRNATYIAQVLQMGYDTVQAIAREFEIEIVAGKPGRKSDRKDRLWPQIKDLAEQGKTQKEISQTVDVSMSTLTRWFREQGQSTTPDYSRQHLNFGKDGAAKGGKAGKQQTIEKPCLHCKKPFSLPHGNKRTSRQSFCSRECAYAHRRANSGKAAVYVCQECGTEFSGWKNTPRLYCSRQCFYRANPSKVRVSDMVLDSSWEALFLGVMAMERIPCQRFDRAHGIEWVPGHWYSPDFHLPTLGLAIEIKGLEDDNDPARWQAFREQRGPLLVLAHDDLEDLMRSNDRKAYLRLGLHR